MPPGRFARCELLLSSTLVNSMRDGNVNASTSVPPLDPLDPSPPLLQANSIANVVSKTKPLVKRRVNVPVMVTS
jgi:hypothetical protein